MKEQNKYLKKAIDICDDYSTITPESDEIEMIWFTPQQLLKYTEFCMKQRKNKTQTDI